MGNLQKGVIEKYARVQKKILYRFLTTVSHIYVPVWNELKFSQFKKMYIIPPPNTILFDMK